MRVVSNTKWPFKSMPVPRDQSRAHTGWRRLTLWVGALALTAGACLAPVVTSTAQADPSPTSVTTCGAGSPNVLTAGQTMSVPDPSAISCLASSDGHYLLILQGDGNLVLYGQPQHFAIWSSGTQGNPGDFLAMQTDGNLVLYTATGVALWSTVTQGSPGDFLAIQTDGNVVIYLPPAGGSPPPSGSATPNVTPTGSAQALWASNTVQPVSMGTTLQAGQSLTAGTYLQSGQYELDMFWSGAAAVWTNPSSPCPTFQFPVPGNTSDGLTSAQLPALVPGSFLAMQTDGNLVLYSPTGTAVWASNSAWGEMGQSSPWAGPLSLVMQTDGNLVVYNGSQPIWATGGNNFSGSLLCPGETISGLSWTGSPFNVMNIFMSMQDQSPDTIYDGMDTIGFAQDGNNWDFVQFYANGLHYDSSAFVKGVPANSYAIMQTDGNLVVYSPTGKAEWSTGTSGNPGAYAWFQFEYTGQIFGLLIMPYTPPGTSQTKPIGTPELTNTKDNPYIPPPAYYGSEYYDGSCFNCGEKGPYYTG
jgi:hypothetical protein